jgi:hypothetical protein
METEELEGTWLQQTFCQGRDNLQLADCALYPLQPKNDRIAPLLQQGAWENLCLSGEGMNLKARAAADRPAAADHPCLKRKNPVCRNELVRKTV